jgi:hypothetical protein
MKSHEHLVLELVVRFELSVPSVGLAGPCRPQLALQRA